MTQRQKTHDRNELASSRLRHRGSDSLTGPELARRKKIIDRLDVIDAGTWLWKGQAETARGKRYPQVLHALGDGMTQLVNARHVVFYLATGWVPAGVQRYRSRDGDPMNVHPDNLVPMLPLTSRRSNNNFWNTERLKSYYG